ncbi:MAG: hypothetical protein JWM80_696 [Cyanobacteria bacterium RYN_339]|nr:hypothetical protein [Cyanobacteria bacterium RYN_339]
MNRSLVLTLLLAGCAPPALQAQLVPAGVPAAAANDRVLLALYTTGSDFEDDVDPADGVPDEQASGKLQPKGAASDDLREIVAGIQALSPARRARTQVLVMMGGARKQGWRGTKLLDGEALVRDAADGYFGNLPAGDYMEVRPEGRMNDPASLQRFLGLVRQHGEGVGTVIVELAGHGCSYAGMGEDENQPEGRRWIPLPAIAGAIHASGVHGAILTFPACHMASLEVARAVGAPFKYLVGSEEGMSAEGWNYRTVFAALGRPAEAVARTYADSLVDDPLHQQTNYKTCSVTDLPKAQAIFPALDAWSGAVDLAQDAEPLVSASKACKGFGIDEPTDAAVSIDAITYFKRVAARSARLRAASERVAALAAAAVVHHRHDPGYEEALGLSIYPPHVRVPTGEEAWYGLDVAASHGFWPVIEGLRPLLPAAPGRPTEKRRVR